MFNRDASTAALIAVVLAAAGCGADPSTAADAGASGGSPPCAALPLRGDAVTAMQAQISAAMVEAGEQAVEPALAWSKGRLYAPNFFEPANVSGRHEQVILVASLQEAEELPALMNFAGLAAELEVDWSAEQLAIVLEWPRQHTYAWGVSGKTLTLHAGHLQPCDELADDRIAFAEDVVFLRVPRVDEAKVVELDGRYRYDEVSASGACTKGSTPIVEGASSPEALTDGAGVRLWFSGGGFGDGGTLFESSSKDGDSWDPPKADAASEVKVVDATALVDRYAPSVIVLSNGGYRVYYGTVTMAGLEQRSAITRATSSDGSTLAGEIEVLGPGAPGAWDAGAVSAPSVLRVNTKYYLWYTGEDAGRGTVGIGLATSKDGASWTRHASNPVLVAGAPGRFDDAGAFSPSVRHDGQRFVMVYTAATGGGDWERPRTASVGVAVSTDGAEWTRLDSPILTAGASWEKNGVHGAALLLEGPAPTVYYTASDADFIRAIGRATCELSTLY